MLKTPYSASTTHLPLLVDLRRLDVLTGVSQKKYLTGDEIVTRAASGQAAAAAPPNSVMNSRRLTNPP